MIQQLPSSAPDPQDRCVPAATPPIRAGLSRGFLPLLGAVLLLGACVAPGHKLTMRPTDPASTIEVEGLSVTLHPLNAQAPAPPAGPAGQDDPSELLVGKLPTYRLGPQDVLLITVWDHPEITMPLGQYRTDTGSGLIVDDDGMLFFPYVGKIRVAGSTVTQVRDQLTQELSKVLQKPQVDVKVMAFRSQKVYVGGEVRNPALYNVTDVPFTLSEAINRAGGFLPTADDSHLLLTRGDRTWRLNFQDILAKGNRAGQILLKDGDSLQVPNSQEAPVYMMGEVNRPGSMSMVHGRLTLAQAISLAGGIDGATADARSIYVIRKGEAASSADAFHLDARNPATMVLADQFQLRPRDIVYVDAGTLVRWSRVMNLLLPTISSVTNVTSNVKYIGQ
jgi:polysaccharide export outer membrane protein